MYVAADTGGEPHGGISGHNHTVNVIESEPRESCLTKSPTSEPVVVKKCNAKNRVPMIAVLWEQYDYHSCMVVFNVKLRFRHLRKRNAFDLKLFVNHKLKQAIYPQAQPSYCSHLSASFLCVTISLATRAFIQ